MNSLFAIQFGDALAGVGSVFSTHWSVVLLIGLLFFVLQVGLCFRFFLRVRRYARILQTLGDGRRGIEVHEARFAWLKWVHQNFPAGTTTPGNYTRDDVLQELDTRIASSPDYLLLQRLGIMAPLLGVILTVLGFAWLKVPDSAEQSLNDILFAVTPLVAGVGTGAVLAFINQGLLHLAGIKAESLRMTARTWFDAAIWSTVGLDTQAATVKAIAGIEKMAGTLAHSADLQLENSRCLAESTGAIRGAATQFGETVAGFTGKIQGLPDTLTGLRAAMHAAVQTFESLMPVAERVVAGLDVSVSAFRTAVEGQFIEAARLHRAAVGDLSDSAGQLNQTTSQLRSGTESLNDVITAHSSSFRELGRALSRSLENELVPTHQQLHAAVTSFGACVGEFSACLRGLRATADGLSSNLETAAQDLGSVASQLEPAMASFRAVVDEQFTAAARQHERNLKGLTGSTEQVRVAVQALSKGAAALEQLLDTHAGLERKIEPAHESLRAATDKIAAVGDILAKSLEGHFATSQQAMGQALDSFSHSADRLASFVEQGLDPVTQRLTVLDQTLSRLEGTVKAIRDFSQVRGEIEKLSQSLAQAAAVSQAIADLPEQVRQILEELVADSAAENTNSRGRLLTWFRGGPQT